jgi:16S rRNA processing protein RimM
MGMEDLFIEVASIIKPVGVHGELKVYPLTSTPFGLDRYTTLYMDCPNEVRTEFKVEYFRINSNNAVLKFVGFNSRDAVENFRDCALFIHQDQLPPTDDGEYRIRDMIGMEVISDEGEELGFLTDVIELAPNDVYQVRSGSRELLIPAIAEVVLDIDLEHRRITVHLMDGLRDLPQSADTE